MSKDDIITYTGLTQQDVQNLAFSLGKSMYAHPTTLLLYGELGAGKTQFVQGFAKAMDIREPITSPTYAIEHRYGSLVHYDLYRIGEQEAAALIEHHESSADVIAIEWAEKLPTSVTDHVAHIAIAITPTSETKRSVRMTFNDVAIPSDAEMQSMREETKIAPHIVDHMNLVADVSGRIADHLISQNMIVRKNALIAAARMHDMIRYIDFAEIPADAPQEWKRMKQRYGNGHERAAEQFLREHGYPDIGRIIARHGLLGSETDPEMTIEEKILTYADKRAMHDTFVSVDERYADFALRYGKNGQPTEQQILWKERIQRIEKELFPDGSLEFKV